MAGASLFRRKCFFLENKKPFSELAVQYMNSKRNLYRKHGRKVF
jgi:hypothetical protein